MSDEVQVPDELQRFINEILEKNDIETTEVKYRTGSEIGYTSKTFTVDANDGRKSLHLFVKMPTGLTWHENLPITKLFENEECFYDSVYPAYRSFLEERGIEDAFRNAPKCYGIRDHMIALENLKHRNFDVFPKGKTMDDEHITLAMKTFAKFHAISYAFKDQKRELYRSFTRKMQNCFTEFIRAAGFDKILALTIKDFLKTLDPVEDKLLLDASGDLVENLVDIVLKIEEHRDEYSTINQGDCWSSNMMYLYDKEDQDKLVDMMVVDWQLTREGSPAADIFYFFYPMSSESTIEDVERYMKVYHDELSKGMKDLGSDPDLLYPYSVFKEEWKKFARFGFAMSFFIVKGLLVETVEAPNLEETPELVDRVVNDGEELRNVLPKYNEDLYNSRMKTIFKHFLQHDLL